jgi:hypothetical protein
MKKFILILILPLLMIGCSTSNHGSFTASSYAESQNPKRESLGKVTGESRQTWVLYLFPYGDSTSTNEAIQDAKSKIAETEYLTDISIDDNTYWSIGYYEQIITVKAEARK